MLHMIQTLIMRALSMLALQCIRLVIPASAMTQALAPVKHLSLVRFSMPFLTLHLSLAFDANGSLQAGCAECKHHVNQSVMDHSWFKCFNFSLFGLDIVC